MGRLDLDAARAEYEGEQHVVVLGGREWHLPAKAVLMVAQYAQDNQIEKAIGALFVEDDAAEVLGPLLNSDDLERIMGLYESEMAGAEVVRTPVTSNGGRSTKSTARRR